MTWLDQLFGSLLLATCLPTLFTHALGLDADTLFVSPLASSCLPACFLTRRAGRCHEMVWPNLFLHGLAGLDALTRWSRLALCFHTCLHLSPHLFPHALAVTRCSGSVSPLCSNCPFVFPLFFSRACWAGCCHEMVWFGQFVSPLVSSRACWAGCCHKTVWLGGLARLALCLPTCFSLFPHLFSHALAGPCKLGGKL